MPRLGESVKLALQLFDGATNKFVRATLRSSDELTTYPTVDLTHVFGGLYVANGFLMPNEPWITCVYRVYDDAGYTVLSADHTIEGEAFELDTSETDAAAAARQVTNLAEHDATQAAVALNETEANAAAREAANLAEHATTQAAINALDLTSGSGAITTGAELIGEVYEDEL